MSSDEYEELKKNGAFIRGAAVITGKVWRGNDVGYWFNGIDSDNLKATEEICSCNGKKLTVEELAQSTLVLRSGLKMACNKNPKVIRTKTHIILLVQYFKLCIRQLINHMHLNLKKRD